MDTMGCGCFKVFPSLLLVVLIAAAKPDIGRQFRDELCYRVCPNELHLPSVVVPGASPEDCPGLRCPPPVCPPPVCPTPPPPQECPPCPGQSPSSPGARVWKALESYTSTPLGYYKYYADGNLDWFDAQQHCESEGAHLVILNSEGEDEFIRTAMRPGWIHIGIHHLIPNGGYATVIGQPVSSTGFNEWLSGHALRNETRNCGFINKSGRGIGMGLCSDTGRFICEI